MCKAYRTDPFKDYIKALVKAWMAVRPYSCVSRACFWAKERYLGNFFQWQWYELDVKQNQFDYDQYQHEANRIASESSRAAARIAHQQTRTASGHMIASCRGEI
jgi:hypothetical protein